jgi:hypothetical protein
MSLEEGIKILMHFNTVSEINLTSKEARVMWMEMSYEKRRSATNAYHTLKKYGVDEPKPLKPFPNNSLGLGCAIQVTVDDRGPMWITGQLVKKLKHVQTPQYVVCCDDHLYYVDADKVYINAADIKDRIKMALSEIL